MRWENNINHDLREVDYTGDDWKILAEDREVWKAYVHAVMNLQRKISVLLVVKFLTTIHNCSYF